jgi:hypothetical protein
MILPMMKLTGWSILLVSAAARLRSTLHDVSAVSLMPIVHEVKRTLKFEDEAEASDVSMPPADETDGSGFVESASDAADDAATDWDTFWTRKPTRDMIRTLSSQEVESNKTDLAVARLDEWMLKFTAFTRRRFPQFGELLEIVWTLGDLEEATSLVTTSVLANDANLWGASALMSVIDVSKPAGKVFETAMLDAERAIAGTMSSGIEIAVRIAKLLKDRHTGDEEADYLKFEAKQYLKLGQDENSVRIAFGMIKSDLSICPKRIREAPHAYLRWLLKKAPPEIAKKCKEIEHQINVAERRQVEPVFNSELLTVEVLTYEMIEMISDASKENKVSIEVAAADKKRKLSGERVKMSKNPPCANCGSSEHGWADCKATTICGLKFCQCARSMACWVDADSMPTKDDLKTAQGRNLPDSLINKLKETRKGKGEAGLSC